jgi:hypothetical protein
VTLRGLSEGIDIIDVPVLAGPSVDASSRSSWSSGACSRRRKAMTNIGSTALYYTEDYAAVLCWCQSTDEWLEDDGAQACGSNLADGGGSRYCHYSSARTMHAKALPLLSWRPTSQSSPALNPRAVKTVST